jgi:hypothetical protein
MVPFLYRQAERECVFDPAFSLFPVNIPLIIRFAPHHSQEVVRNRPVTVIAKTFVGKGQGKADKKAQGRHA